MSDAVVAVVGLGMIGAAVAKHLSNAGHPVVGYDVISPHADFPRTEILTAASPAEAAKRADYTVIAVYDDEQVIEVVAGGQGIARSVPAGHSVIVLSTVSRATIETCAAALAEAGVTLLDCGVSGGHELASGGRLSLSVGGDQQVFAEALPVLSCFGHPIHYMGGRGTGMAAKLARNLLHYSTAAVDLESARLALAAGVDEAAFKSFIRSSDVKSPGRMHYVAVDDDGVIEPPSLPSLDYAIKDLAAAAELARGVGLDLLLGTAMRSIYEAARERSSVPSTDAAS